jgi:uncharacterized membrane protein YjgN (DUF898 family)
MDTFSQEPPRPPDGGAEDELAPLPFEFTGSAGEYFRIWIVNLALTLVTLGIYGPWAKVRTQRWFHGHLQLDGHGFGYHAQPRAILFGRLIALGILLAYGILGELSPAIGALLGIALTLAIPEAIRRSLRFRARNTSYRGIRFAFEGDYLPALLYFAVALPFVALSLGLLWPLVHGAQRRWYAGNHRFGTAYFEPDFGAGAFYGPALRAVGLGLLVAAGAAVLAGLAVGLAAAVPLVGQLPVLGATGGAAYAVVLFAVPFVVTGIYQAGTWNVLADHTHLRDHGFVADVDGWRLAWIHGTNTLAIVASLGLLIPWAVVRLARYRAECTWFLAAEGFETFMAGAQDEQGALGEELGELLDLEIGL